MMVGLTADHGEEKTVRIDATDLKAHRMATSMAAKTGWSPDRAHQGRHEPKVRAANTKLHAIRDSKGRPLAPFVTAGQVSDAIGARAPLSSLPKVDWRPGDRGYDADRFRDALKDTGRRAVQGGSDPPEHIRSPFTSGRKHRKSPVKCDTRRHRIEVPFGRLADWRRTAPRHDRCPKVFLPASALAPTVIS